MRPPRIGKPQSESRTQRILSLILVCVAATTVWLLTSASAAAQTPPLGCAPTGNSNCVAPHLTDYQYLKLTCSTPVYGSSAQAVMDPPSYGSTSCGPITSSGITWATGERKNLDFGGACLGGGSQSMPVINSNGDETLNYYLDHVQRQLDNGSGCESANYLWAHVRRQRSLACPDGYFYTSGYCEMPGSYADTAKDLGKTCPQKGECTVGNPVNVSTGNKYQLETDFVGVGPNPLLFERTYNSYAQISGNENGAYTFSTPGDAFGGSSPVLVGMNTENDNGTAVIAAGSIGAAWRHTYHRAIFPRNGTTVTGARVYRPDGAVIPFVFNGTLWRPDASVNYTLTEILTGGVRTGWELETPDDELELYSAEGRLLSIEDRDGNTATLTYDSVNRLESVTDEFGRTLTFGYAVAADPTKEWWEQTDVVNQITSMTDPDGKVTTYTYDTADYAKLIKVTYPDGGEREYVYDEPSHEFALTGIIDGEDRRYATWEYDVVARASRSFHGTGADVTDEIQINYTQWKGYSFWVYHLTSTIVTESPGTPEEHIRDYKINRKFGEGFVTSIVEDGQTKTFSRDNNSNVATTTDYDGKQRSQSFDLARNLLTSVTDAFGTTDARTTTIDWHANYRLPERIVYPSVFAGGTHEVDVIYYPGTPRVHQIVESGFESSGTPISRTTSFSYNANGRVSSVDGPLAGTADTWTFNYYNCTTGGECGEMEYMIDPNGFRTDFTEYDGVGRLIAFEEPNGLETRYGYDERGRITSITQTTPIAPADIRTMSFTYDLAGLMTSTTDFSGRVTTYEYDTAHNLRAMIAPSGQRITYDPDTRGNPAIEKRILPNGVGIAYAVTRVYDEDGRVLETQLPQPGGAGTDDWVQVFDQLGQLQSSTDPTGIVTTLGGYDHLRRVGSSTVNGIDVTTFDYDVKDNVTEVVAPNGAVTEMEFDDFGRMTREISADRGTVTMVYNEADNLVSRTDADGRVTSYQYDDGYRLTQIDKQIDNYDGTTTTSLPETVTIYYDNDDTDGTVEAFGRPLPVTSSSIGGNLELAYDFFGRVVEKSIEHLTGVSLYSKYTYDDDDRISTVRQGTNHGGGSVETLAVEFAYDSDGRISGVDNLSVSPATALISGITHQPWGPRDAATFSNGQTETRTIDQRYRVEDIVLAGTVGRTANYVWTARDEVQYLDHDGVSGAPYTHAFAYDYQGRLESDIHRLEDKDAYTYDSNGNRLTYERRDYTTNILEVSDSYSYTPNSNRLLSIADLLAPPAIRNLELDSAGNTTRRDSSVADRLMHDSNGQIRQAYFASEEYLYEYNAVGQRVSKSRWVSTGAGGGCLDYDREEVIVFLYDGGSNLIGEQIYAEPAGQACTDASVELVAQRDYVWVNDEPMIMQLTNYGSGYVVLSADTYFIHTDHLTTPRTVTDSAGALAWSRSESTAFGDGGGQKFSSTANFEMNLRFPGQYSDLETGLHYNYFRTYDPSTGRYLESDPIGLNGGLNTYGYVYQNPLSYYDPYGQNAYTLGRGAFWGGQRFGQGINWLIYGATGATLGSLLYDAFNESYDPNAPSYAQEWVDDPRAKAEHDAYKERAGQAPPPFLDPCERLKWMLRREQDVVAAMTRWDAKWLPGRHDTAIQQRKQAIRKLQKQIKQVCAPENCP